MGQQLSSQIQLQQRSESVVDDRHKVSAVSSSDMKPLLSSIGQPSSVAPLGDTSSAQKVCLVVRAFFFIGSILLAALIDRIFKTEAA